MIHVHFLVVVDSTLQYNSKESKVCIMFKDPRLGGFGAAQPGHELHLVR